MVLDDVWALLRNFTYRPMYRSLPDLSVHFGSFYKITEKHEYFFLFLPF